MFSSKHFVHFYEDNNDLITGLTKFISKNLASCKPSIVIATRSHRQALESALTAKGLDIKTAKAKGYFISLDAKVTLGTFMVDGMPDVTKFQKTISDVLAAPTLTGQPIRAFGEMVALLWAEGNTSAAVKLEELWEDFLEKKAISLYCAYPLDELAGENYNLPYTDIVKNHSQVILAESFV